MKRDEPNYGEMLRASLPPVGLHDDTWLCTKCRTTTKRTTEDYNYDITCGYDGEIMILVSRRRVVSPGEFLDAMGEIMRIDGEARRRVREAEEETA